MTKKVTKKHPKILTVAIPTYNVDKYLQRCIDSLIFNKDTIKDVEIIIVNDGGMDRSLVIANDYAERYPNSIKVIDKENGGHGSTINAALREATGKYFKVIDGDDWVDVDDFIRLVHDLKRHDEDLVICDYTIEYADTGASYVFRYKNLNYDQTYVFDKFDFSKLGLDYFVMHTITYKTSVLKEAKLKLSEKMFYVDMQYIIFPLSHVSDFVYLKHNVYRYFIGRKDQSVNPEKLVKNRKQHETILKSLIDYVKNNKLSKNKQDYIKNILKQMLNTHYVIYLMHPSQERSQKREIRQLDKYIKAQMPELYNLPEEIFIIKAHRLTNFMFSTSQKHYFSKICRLLKRFVLKLHHNKEIL